MKSAPSLQPAIQPGTTVTQIGLGGTGGLLSRLVATLLANQRPADEAVSAATRHLLIDGDIFDPEANKSRQWFRRAGPKADVLKEELLEYFPDSPCTILAVAEYVTADNLARLIPASGPQVICLAVDNHKTRKLVSDHVENLALADDDVVALISGGNDPVVPGAMSGSYGNVQCFIRRGARASVPLTRHHAEIAAPSDRLPTELSCTEQLESTPQLLAANAWVAACMFSTLMLCLADFQRFARLPYSEVFFDFKDGLMRPAAHPAPAFFIAPAE